MERNNRAKEALRMAMQPWGASGWAQLTPAMRRAFIAEAAVNLLLAQDESLEKYRAGKELVEACMAADEADEAGRRA